MKNLDDYVYFVFVSPYNESYGFTGYTDKKGKRCFYSNAYDKNNQPIPFKWRFDQNHRVLKVHKEQVDILGTNAVEYLRSCPDCVGSSNSLGDGKAGWFKEMNEDRDADLAMEVKQLRTEAATKAINAKGADFEDMCSLLGIFNGSESTKRFKLTDAAEADPKTFLKVYEDPTRKIRGLIRKALDSGVFRKEGPMIFWENKEIGQDEDYAVATLKTDEKLRKAVESNIAKFA